MLFLLYKVVKQKNNCQIYRQLISKIGNVNCDSKKLIISIKVGDLNINYDNNQINTHYSKYCLNSKKSEPSNQLVLCYACKYNLIHSNCKYKTIFALNAKINKLGLCLKTCYNII